MAGKQRGDGESIKRQDDREEAVGDLASARAFADWNSPGGLRRVDGDMGYAALGGPILRAAKGGEPDSAEIQRFAVASTPEDAVKYWALHMLGKGEEVAFLMAAVHAELRPFPRAVRLSDALLRHAGPDASLLEGGGMPTDEAADRLRRQGEDGVAGQDGLIGVRANGQVGFALLPSALVAGKVELGDPIDMPGTAPPWIRKQYSDRALERLERIIRNGWRGYAAWVAREGAPEARHYI